MQVVLVEQVDLAVQVALVEQVNLDDEGHQVALVEQVGLMARVGQVVPDKLFDLQRDHKMALSVQHFDQSENEAAEVAPKVEKDGFSPQYRMVVQVDNSVSLPVLEVALVGP